jgi:hypothetical protein
MPRGLKRFHHTGQSHFVTFCCYHRRRLLATDESRRIFESALERVRRRFKLYVYGYVVMPEHVHLLLGEPQWDRSSDRIDPLKPKDGLNGPPVIRSALCSCKLHHRRLLVHRVNVFRKSCRDHCPHVSDTFAGIRPQDAPLFIAAQFAGAFAATALFRWLVPRVRVCRSAGGPLKPDFGLSGMFARHRQ